jgi:hypothetical protein
VNSRERVLAAIEHRPVDRVPIDFGGHRSSGIVAGPRSGRQQGFAGRREIIQRGPEGRNACEST